MTFSLEVVSPEVTTSTSDFGGITLLEFHSHPVIQEISLDSLISCLKSYPLHSFLIRKNNSIRNAN
jgi:hypothetical protein